MKKILLAFLIALPLVTAAFNLQLGYTWLIGQSDQGSYNNDIQSAVLASLALKNAGAVLEAEQALEWIKSKEDPEGCFPTGACNVKDTAFAYLLYYTYNEDTSNIDSWMKSSVSTALSGGNWWLQIATSSAGTCGISYEKNSELKENTISVDQGKFPECSSSGPDTFYDLNKCLEPNLLTNMPFLEFDIDCSELGSAVISAVFQSQNTYYLLDEASTTTATIAINNGCFGQKAKGSCDIETSLLANWILSEVASSLSVTPWLESNYNSENALHNSLLYLATGKDIYLDDLKGLQKTDGSFGSVYDTSFAVIALDKAGNLNELSKATSWLQKQQKTDGSWNSKVLDTAAALYSSFGRESVSGLPSCFNGIRDGDENGVDCGGLICGPCSFTGPVCGDAICDFDEDEFSCPQDCRKSSACIEDGFCDVYAGEDSTTCAFDCFCGDDVCDSVEESGGTCEVDCQSFEEAYCGNDLADSSEEECDGSDDSACPGLCNVDCTCEEKKSSFKWVIPLIVILLIGFAVYFFWFRKRGGGEEKKVEPKFTFQQPKSNQSQAGANVQLGQGKSTGKSMIEEQLDKSLKEAKKLFGK